MNLEYNGLLKYDTFKSAKGSHCQKIPTGFTRLLTLQVPFFDCISPGWWGKEDMCLMAHIHAELLGIKDWLTVQDRKKEIPVDPWLIVLCA